MHISSNYLFTGGKDEFIRVYNLKKHSSEGGISGTKGTINKFAESEKYLLVSGSDGKMMIYGIKDRSLYHSIKCHTTNFSDFDVHSSGRMFVSAGADKKIKLWNMMDMKEVYHKNIQRQVEFVRFAPDENLIIGFEEDIVVFNIKTGNLDAAITHIGRLTQVTLEKDVLVTSGICFFYLFR